MVELYSEREQKLSPPSMEGWVVLESPTKPLLVILSHVRSIVLVPGSMPPANVMETETIGSLVPTPLPPKLNSMELSALLPPIPK